MSPDERREVLEQLLARVRQTVAERGLHTPVDLPARSLRPPPVAAIDGPLEGTADGVYDDNSGHANNHRVNDAPFRSGFHEMETAYAEVAPVVLATAMGSAPPPPMPASPMSRPLVRFEFEDEVTATGDPDQIEAMALAEAVAAEAEQRASEPPLSGPSTMPPAMQQPVQQVEPVQYHQQVMNQQPPARVDDGYERRLPPLELDDLDSLGAPPPVSPSDAPPPPFVPPPPRYEPASPTTVDESADDDEVIELEASDLSSVPPEPVDAQQDEPVPETEHAGFVDRVSIEDIEAAALPDEAPVEPPPVMAEAEAIPESQRVPRALDRPIDDVIEGIDHDDEPPPESGEVESQRYPADASPIADEVSVDQPIGVGAEVDADDAPTPRPVLHEQTAETRSIGAVDVIDRPPPPEVQVASFSGSRPRTTSSFGEILDQALSLGE